MAAPVRVVKANTVGSDFKVRELVTIPWPLLLTWRFLRTYWRQTLAVILWVYVWWATGSWVWACVVVGVSAACLWMGVVTLAWSHAAAGPSRPTFTGTLQGMRWRKRLRARWPLACERVGLLGLTSKSPPRLRKVRLTGDGGVEATVPLGAWGRTPDDLKAGADTMSHIVGCRQVTVRTLGPGVAHVVFTWGDPLNRTLTLADMKTPAPGQITVGLTDSGQPASITAHRSLLIVGESGAGKSSTLWSLIASLVQQQVPVRLCVVDPAGGVELDALGEVLDPEGAGSFVVEKYVGLPNKKAVHDLLDQTTSAMFRRLASMKARGVRQHVPTLEEPLYVVIIDELLLLSGELKDDHSQLRQILAIGRKTAFTVWACSQMGQKDTIGAVRDLFQQRILHHVKSRDLVDATLGTAAFANGAHATTITRPGVGYMVQEGSDGFRRFRSVLVSDAETRQLARGVAPARLKQGRATAPILEPDVPTALYRWWGRPKGSTEDLESVLLYVGMSNDPVARIGEHELNRRPDHWSRRVTGSTVEWFGSRAEAEAAEKLAIQTEHPEANVAFAGRRSRA